MSIKFALLLLIPLVYAQTFTVDYENNRFLKDGKPFRYVSGSIHYFRVPWQFWGDRIYKMKMAGLNAIQTYVEWNHHEPEPGRYNFNSNYDLRKFLQTAKYLDMLVILRTGPFIDAERDMGGLPYWLLRIKPDIKLRSYDETYIKYVTSWYSVLLPIIKPYLYENGGPIIMIQIENEYGSIGPCDAHYKSHLRDVFRYYLGPRVVLFTTDGWDNKALTCGKTDQVFSTIDFGTDANVTSVFNLLHWIQASGPLVNSEFYPGWLDHWGQPHANVSIQATVKTLQSILEANASVNVYMFHGGTSFGFSAGSNLGSTFQACPTSYDYDAPLSEAGDPTPKYYAMRNVIGKFLPLPKGSLPKPAPKLQLSNITLEMRLTIWDYLAATSKPISSPYPLSFEDLYHPYGFIMYETNVGYIPTDPVVLTVPDLADRGYVYVNQGLQGILSREQKIFQLPIRIQKGNTLSIFVENQGRICSGPSINDRKGIFRNVTLGSRTLYNWTMKPFLMAPMILSSLLKNAVNRTTNNQEKNSVPAFYFGKFAIPDDKILDTFLRLDGWHKGVAFINEFNLGRYWPIVGPQVTLYTPSSLLKGKPYPNTLTLLELEHSPCKTSETCVVNFVAEAVVNGTTPNI